MENSSAASSAYANNESEINEILAQCSYGKLTEAILNDVLIFTASYPQFEVSMSYEGNKNNKVIVLYGKESIYKDEYLREMGKNVQYNISIVLPSGYPYKAPKIYILDELSDFENSIISKKNNKLKITELRNWTADDGVDLTLAYARVIEALTQYPPVKGVSRKSK